MEKFVSDIQSQKDLYTNRVEIGSEIELTRNYNSLKALTKYKLIGFMNDDTSKLILEGCIPGGWVNVNHVHKDIDYNNLRFITIDELIECFGQQFFTMTMMNTSFLKILGYPVDHLRLHSNGSISAPLIWGNTFMYNVLTRQDKRPSVTKINIIARDYRKDLDLDLDSFNNYVQTLKGSGLEISDLGTKIGEVNGKSECMKFMISYLSDYYYLKKMEDKVLNIHFSNLLLDFEYDVKLKAKKIEKEKQESSDDVLDDNDVHVGVHHTPESIKQDGGKPYVPH